MNINYKAVDLHVHTPASSGCYIGEKDRDEYIKILTHYVENNVSLIAITDHNTINGYKTLMDIKSKLIQKMEKIKELEDLTGVKSSGNEISRELELFEQINIIPGVEIEINPGIHLLVIFNPENDIYEIEKILIEIGYESEVQGNEIGVSTKIDILQLFDRLNNVDCIVIGAHIDSSKGIYQVTSGSYRVNILKNERLNGLQFNNQTQADMLENLFKRDPLYKRKSSVAFLKASDFHGDYEAGIQKTYFYLEENGYLNLKECFNSPEEKISLTSNPEHKTIINKILASPNSLAIDFLQDDIKFAEKVCAILNEGFGYIVIGVKENEHKNIIGTSQEKEDIRIIFTKLLDTIKNNSGKFEISISISKYDWIDKYIHIISLNTSKNTIYFLSNEKSYYLEKNKVKEYKTEEIIVRASSNMLNSYKNYIKFNNKRLGVLQQKMQLLNEINLTYDKFIKFESKTRDLEICVDIEKLVFENLDIPNITSAYGEANPNVFIPEDAPSRFDQCYNRYIPMGVNVEVYDKRFSHESIIITPKGAVYYLAAKTDYDVFNRDSINPLYMLKLKPENTKLSMKYISAWLKSSLCLYFIYATTTDFKDNLGQILSKTIIPKINNESMLKIEGIVDKIIEMEEAFLNETTQICKLDCNCDFSCYTCSTLDELYEKADKLNNSIGEKMAEIDYTFYNSLDIDENTIDIINKFLRSVNYCIFYQVDKNEEVADSNVISTECSD